MLSGRLGLETARIPQADRHGLLWLRRGNLYVENGTLRFIAAGGGDFPPGDYALPYQMLTAILLEPGTTVSHDALRLLASHGTSLVAIGENGTRYYASLPHGPDRSARARTQARAWADRDQRQLVVRRMYAWRLGEVFPNADIEVLRGMEGARMKELYAQLARQYGVTWRRRQYDRSNPDSADMANQSINHASSAVYAAADVAVAVTGAIPQLGFVHEDSGYAFCLDVADLFRDSVTIPLAFAGLKQYLKTMEGSLERHIRKTAGSVFRKEKLVPSMIDRIKELFDGDDDRGDP